MFHYARLLAFWATFAPPMFQDVSPCSTFQGIRYQIRYQILRAVVCLAGTAFGGQVAGTL